MFHHVIFFQMLKAMVKPWPNRSIMSWRQNWIFHGDWVLAGHCRGRPQQWQYLCSRVSEHRGGTCPFRIFFGSFSDGNWPEKKVDSDWNQHRLKHRFQWTSMNINEHQWTMASEDGLDSWVGPGMKHVALLKLVRASRAQALSSRSLGSWSQNLMIEIWWEISRIQQMEVR